MTDHVTEALRRYEAADYARQMTDTDPDLLVTVALHESAQAQVHATLEVAEHVEFAGQQLRRLADAVETLVAEFRPWLATPVSDPDEPCAHVYPGAPGEAGPRCATPRGVHVNVLDHEWIGAPR